MPVAHTRPGRAEAFVAANDLDMTAVLQEHGHEVCKIVRLFTSVYTPAIHPSLTDAERAAHEKGRWERVRRSGTRAFSLAPEIRRLLEARRILSDQTGTFCGSGRSACKGPSGTRAARVGPVPLISLIPTV